MQPSTPVLAAPSCVENADSWCAWVWDRTDNAWLAYTVDWFLATPAKILLILLVGFVVRGFVRRGINRLTRTATEDTVPLLLRPLKEASGPIRVAASPWLTERRKQRASTIGSVLGSLTSFIVFGIVLVLILGELGINLAPIIASAGIAGVALGFGAQNLVRDFLSGIFMVLEDQYGVGDVVDLGEATGVVESVGLRVTTLRDVSGTVWYVRNGEVMRVGNMSQGYAVAVVDLPLAHSADFGRAVELAGETADEVTSAKPLADHVLAPPEVLGLDAVTADTVTLRLTVKVRAGRQWSVQRALRAKIKKVFDAEGIPAPYPSGRPVPPPL